MIHLVYLNKSITRFMHKLKFSDHTVFDLIQKPDKLDMKMPSFSLFFSN